MAWLLVHRRHPGRTASIWLASSGVAARITLASKPAFGPRFNSHLMITEWSLRLSERSLPHTRGEMLREWRPRVGQAAESV